MSRLPIRLRLTAGFALAMTAVLVGAGAFVYLRVRTGLDDSINEGLRARADATVRLARQPQTQLGQPGAALTAEEAEEQAEESFTQILAPSARVLDSTLNLRRAVLTPVELGRVAGGPVLVERELAGFEGRVRVRAQAVQTRRGSPVVAVGQSIHDRDEALSALVAAFAVGGPAGVLVASLVGYLLTAAGLRPVEAMRRRAGEVSLTHADERLPLPAARDEIRRLGETLNAMLGRLRRSFERERQFVADASHELRTPVAVLKTEIESALRTGDYGPLVRESLAAALEECDHLAALAEDLLVVARSSDGKLPVRPETLDVRSALESVRERYADRAGQRGRPIAIDAPPDLQVAADPLRLRQALGNLVDNALRHGEGEIVLRGRRDETGVEIEVSDQGPGFAPELSEHAFERFTRGDSARTRGGVGLGMAIVKAIADAHGGRVSICPGEGTTVRLWLPATEPARSGAPPPGAPEHQPA